MPEADLDNALGTAQRVLLDSSTLIAFHYVHETVHTLAKHLLRRIEDDADVLHGYYSVISASELLVRPIRSSTADFTYMHAFLTHFPHLTVLPLDFPVAVQAANLRERLSLPDALIVASGLLAGCEAIISNDERWQRRLAPLFPRFRWIYLGDYV